MERKASVPMSIEQAARQWQTEGWVLVPDLLPTGEIDEAVEELWSLYPRPEEFHAEGNPRREAFLAPRERKWAPPDVADDEPAFREVQLDGIKKFPYPTRGRLNRLLLHPRLIEFAETALASSEIRLYGSSLWAKYKGAANYAQPLHTDRNHSVVPPRMDPGWWHMEGFLYLCDVDEGNGATQLLRLRDSPKPDPQRPLSPEEAPEPYSKLVSAPGRRGSFLAYRPDVWHRGVDLRDDDASRFIMTLGFKLSGQEWIGFDGIADFVDNWHFLRLASSCTPKELALFGVPEPGHPFWTEAGVEALAERYAGLDVEPWRTALRDSDD